MVENDRTGVVPFGRWTAGSTGTSHHVDTVGSWHVDAGRLPRGSIDDPDVDAVAYVPEAA
jgi:hypothetical protein